MALPSEPGHATVLALMAGAWVLGSVGGVGGFTVGGHERVCVIQVATPRENTPLAMENHRYPECLDHQSN